MPVESGKPIRPSDVVALRSTLIPPVVIDVFNQLIASYCHAGRGSFTQNLVVNSIIANSTFTRGQIDNNHWLDVEDIYRSAGWDVEYDKPGYNESYPAMFTFTAKQI